MRATITGWESASELLKALADGSVTTVDLVRTYVSRIQTETWVNAVIHIAHDAIQQARKLDDERNRGQLRGPLHGLPVTVKDDLLVAGMPATYGAVENSGFIAEEDAPIVRHLKSAGALIFGKTNLPRFAADGQTYNDLFGTTRNPWDATRTCGGSSGGSAAALAAGMTALELGSDLGGSVRIPAAWCGIYGLKPTWGILPHGGDARNPTRKHESRTSGPPDIAMRGPLARSAADLSLALDVLRGDSKDHKGSTKDSPPIDLSQITLSLWLTDESLATANTTLFGLERWCRELEFHGVTLDRSSRPPGTLERLEFIFETLFMANKAASFDEATLAHTLAVLESQEPYNEVAGIHRRALTMTDRESVEIQNERQELRRLWKQFFADGRLLVTPTVFTTAFSHDQSEPAHDRKIHVDNRRVPHRPYLTRWCVAPGVLLLPSLSMPAGLSDEGLPIGVQLVGPEYSDYRLIKIAEAIETTLGGFQRPLTFR